MKDEFEKVMQGMIYECMGIVKLCLYLPFSHFIIYGLKIALIILILQLKNESVLAKLGRNFRDSILKRKVAKFGVIEFNFENFHRTMDVIL